MSLSGRPRLTESERSVSVADSTGWGAEPSYAELKQVASDRSDQILRQAQRIATLEQELASKESIEESMRADIEHLSRELSACRDERDDLRERCSLLDDALTGDTDLMTQAENRRRLIVDTASDLMASFLYYDRKEDQELPRGEIESALLSGEITVEELLDVFRRALEDAGARCAGCGTVKDTQTFVPEDHVPARGACLGRVPPA